MKRVYISKIARELDLKKSKISEALNWINCKSIVKKDARIFLKPNFTYPFYKPGVTTSPAFIEAVISVLKEYSSNITIGEANGGSYAWTAEEAFEGHDIYKIASKYNIKVVNLSNIESEYRQVKVGSKRIMVHLPSLLINNTDVFITLPVPKVHVMTGVSLSFKNQWGCIPDVMRLKNHFSFNEYIVAINKILRPSFAIFDGTYFLDRTGPMEGDAIPMDLLIASNDIGAGSFACCKIMNLDPQKVKHLQIAKKEGLFPLSLEEIKFNDDIEKFRTRQFKLERSASNYMALVAFNSKWLTNLIYISPFATPIHKILYLIRGEPKDYKKGY